MEITGPVQGAMFLGQPMSYDLAALGYSNDEYFLAGSARSYTTPAQEAPFRTRAIVRRPLDPARFDGTVVVKWFNVSGGLDAAPDWSFVHRHLMRRGHAWVGVSAQRVGIEGGGFSAVSFPLKKVNAERYGALSHPGDAFAFDIFSQAGRAVRDARLLDGLTPRRLLAIGESQSAMFLVSYVNHVDPEARVFNGFLIHGRGGKGAPLDGGSIIRGTPEERAEAVRTGRASLSHVAGSDRIRPDVRVPVLTVQSETDVVGLGSVGARQDDTERIRLWEVAGAAHADTYLLVGSGSDDGSLAPAELARLLAPTTSVFGMTMDKPMNAGPQQHYVLQAALAHLERWAGGGAPPPQAPRLELADGGTSPFALDANGNVRGGLRTPWVDVPTAVLSGLGQSGAEFAFLFGTTRPFDATTLARLYPGGKADYLARFARATAEALSAGFLLEDDVPEIEKLAAAGAFAG
jgi:Alpha/beta hydrolase domain